MYTNFNVQLIDGKCPDNMTQQNCPLRSFVDKDQDTFHISTFSVFVNEILLVPNNPDDTNKIIKTWNDMRAICAKCQANNSKQKTK